MKIGAATIFRTWLILAAMLPGAVSTERPGGRTIQGRLADSSGAVIAGAAVQVKGPSGAAGRTPVIQALDMPAWKESFEPATTQAHP